MFIKPVNSRYNASEFYSGSASLNLSWHIDSTELSLDFAWRDEMCSCQAIPSSKRYSVHKSLLLPTYPIYTTPR
jgi:hypothetical protein